MTLAALVLTIATLSGSTTSSPPSHGAGSVVPAAARTTTPAPPVGVVVTITQNPDDCRLVLNITNNGPLPVVFSRTDEDGMQPPMGLQPGRTGRSHVVNAAGYWHGRVSPAYGFNPDGTGGSVDMSVGTELGGHLFGRPCIGTAPDQPTTSIGEPLVLVRGGQVEVRRFRGWWL